jgi:hypothetical protein
VHPKRMLRKIVEAAADAGGSYRDGQQKQQTSKKEEDIWNDSHETQRSGILTG